jgi:hypothetical protein
MNINASISKMVTVKGLKSDSFVTYNALHD